MSPVSLAVLVLSLTTTLATLVSVRLVRSVRIARTEVDRLRERARTRSQPHDALAHEIRTPLTLIRASAELLAEETPGELNETQRRFVTTIVDNSTQAISMAEDFLTQARLDHALFALRMQDVELRALVRDLIQELRRTSRTTMRLESHGAPIRMIADPNLLRQAIANTVTNALRHAGEGVTITISVTADEDSAVLTIADDGAGMTRDQRAHLFTPFSSQGSLSSPVSQGVGLGMLLTQQVLELHGGRVLVDTLTARGTAVYLTMPLRNVRTENSENVDTQ